MPASGKDKDVVVIFILLGWDPVRYQMRVNVNLATMVLCEKSRRRKMGSFIITIVASL